MRQRKAGQPACIIAVLEPVLRSITYKLVDSSGKYAPADFIVWENNLKLSKLQAVQAALKSQEHDLHDRDHWNNQVARYRARLAICSIPGDSGMLQPVTTPPIGQPTTKRQRESGS
jgi:hypothetical protein